ncbi:hypothetical protein ACHQM5_005642 [Ranunculus cassubicifolius]
MNPSPSSSSSTYKTLNSSAIYLKSLNSLSLPPPHLLLSPLPPLPPSNLIPSTRFIIDGFKHSGTHSITYFLSHFHSDHYTGLSPNWSTGLIFCSYLTGKLLIEVLKIPREFVISLSLCKTVLIDDCEVTLIDANHCPGAVQFLFRVRDSRDGKWRKYVHTGDFRFKNSMKLEPLMKEFVGSDSVFLDTTYCNPKFVFPEQDESVNYVVETIERVRSEEKNNVLFLVATYVIGKEKILLEIAKRCGCLIYVDARKMGILSVLGFGKSGVFTEDASLSNVHVVGWNVLGETWPYFRPNFGKMKEMMVEKGYDRVVGFVPTGWMYEARRDGFAVRSKESLEIHLVPYSEHSSYDELREYVKFLKPKQVIPTVGMDIDKLDSKHAIAMRKHFAGLVDEMANKKEFLKGFHRRNVKKDEMSEDDISNELTKESKCDKEVEPLELPSAMSSQEPDSQDIEVPNEKDPDNILEELRLFLPVWVTQDQIAELLNSTSGSVVEAVSQFYERETEFHKQVSEFDNQNDLSKTASTTISSVVPETGSNTSIAIVPKTTANSIIALIPKSSVRNTNAGSLTNILSSNKKLPATKKSNKVTVSPKKRGIQSDKTSKVTVSPKKRGSQSDKTSKKKARSCSTTESSGSKQTAITKFFSKLEHGASALELGGPKQTEITKFFCKPVCSTSEVFEASASLTEEGRNTLNLLPKDVPESFKENLVQFLQVIEGSVSESEAALILEKAKGDLTVALDIYCNNSGGNFNDKEKIPLSSESDLVQSCENEKNSCKETSNMSILPVQGFSTENANASLILLPLEKYSPVEHACWKQGQPAPYLHIARAFDLVEGERGKIKATVMLCNMFRSLLVLSPEDVLPAVYLCTNKIAPDHANMELNIGGSLVCSALEEACGTNKNKIREMYNSLGDLGDVAQVCRQTQTLLVPPSPLTIQEVFSALRKISLETGQGSTTRKKSLIARLMRSCREKEIKFLVRTLVRNLRIGAMMRTILPALAQGVVIHSSPNLLQDGPAEVLKQKLQGISAAVVEAYNVLPDLDFLIPSLISKGVDFSSLTLSMVPGIPVRPMLARITNGVSQAIKQFQGRAFTCEYKYDGQRAQIHKLEDGSLKVFSRNGDETTSKFPDLINIMKESCKAAAETFILDAEVVAVDRKNGCKLMSFQELSSRERGNKNSLISLDSIKMKEYFSEEKILSKKPPYYQTAEVPDKWFSPELVWEIRGADFTISPVHHAAFGLVHPSRGISIRFPRYIRSRPDKKVEDCSTAMDVADMFQSQTRKMDVTASH